jgi:hypothetical protein
MTASGVCRRAILKRNVIGINRLDQRDFLVPVRFSEGPWRPFSGQVALGRSRARGAPDATQTLYLFFYCSAVTGPPSTPLVLSGASSTV